jgi:tetratricopeptide (TPR) repeat protein
MAGRIIPLIPVTHGEPSQLLRAIRERCGLSPREFAPLLGRAVGRPELTAGAIRAWEAGTVRPPHAILEAAAQVAQSLPRHAVSAPADARRPELPNLSDLRQGLRSLDGAYGRAAATSLLPAAGRHLGQIELLRGTTRAARFRRELDASQAEAATLMGQLVWDASQRRDHQTARAFFDEAIAAARRVGDPVAAGHALLRKSYIALYGERDALSGLALAQEAAETTEHSSRTVAGLGLLHAAEAHAMLASQRECERALAAAESRLTRIDHRDSAAFLFAQPEFDRLAGSCYLELGRYDKAASILTTTAARLHDRQKSRAIVLGNLALAHLRQGEVDAAAGVLHQAIDMTAQVRGGGGLNLIFQAARELAPWRQEPVVQYVEDRIHDLMATP